MTESTLSEAQMHQPASHFKHEQNVGTPKTKPKGNTMIEKTPLKQNAAETIQEPLNTDTPKDQLTVEQWLQIRKEEAQKIDPETAEVDWSYGQIGDPYCVVGDLTEEEYCVGRVYFARSPGSDIWVSFYDLPRETLDKLRETHGT